MVIVRVQRTMNMVAREILNMAVNVKTSRRCDAEEEAGPVRRPEPPSLLDLAVPRSPFHHHHQVSTYHLHLG